MQAIASLASLECMSANAPWTDWKYMIKQEFKSAVMVHQLCHTESVEGLQCAATQCCHGDIPHGSLVLSCIGACRMPSRNWRLDRALLEHGATLASISPGCV